MPYERVIDAAFVHYRWRGEFTKSDLLAIGRELPELAQRLGYAPNVLHTFPKGLAGKIEPWTVFEHSIRRRNTVLQNPAKVAWVAREPQLLAVGRMLQELNRNPNIAIEIFAGEAAARRWLSGGALGGSSVPKDQGPAGRSRQAAKSRAGAAKARGPARPRRG